MPSRQAKKQIDYTESDGNEEDEEIFKQLSANTTRPASKRRKGNSMEDSDDDFGMDEATEAALVAADGT